jgi:hypothetical protein
VSRSSKDIGELFDIVAAVPIMNEAITWIVCGFIILHEHSVAASKINSTGATAYELRRNDSGGNFEMVQ